MSVVLIKVVTVDNPNCVLSLPDYENGSFVSRHETVALDEDRNIICKCDTKMTILPSGDVKLEGVQVSEAESYLIKLYWVAWNAEYWEVMHRDGKTKTLRFIE